MNGCLISRRRIFLSLYLWWTDPRRKTQNYWQNSEQKEWCESMIRKKVTSFYILRWRNVFDFPARCRFPFSLTFRSFAFMCHTISSEEDKESSTAMQMGHRDIQKQALSFWFDQTLKIWNTHTQLRVDSMKKTTCEIRWPLRARRRRWWRRGSNPGCAASRQLSELLNAFWRGTGLFPSGISPLKGRSFSSLERKAWKQGEKKQFPLAAKASIVVAHGV